MTAWPMRIDPIRLAQVWAGSRGDGSMDGILTFSPRTAAGASIVRSIRRTEGYRQALPRQKGRA
ncbi:hypothetical protein GCM10010458_26620 [Microbacterium luteolum]